VLHFDPGSGTYHQNGSYTVQDLAGKTVLTVPYHPVWDAAYPIASPINSLQLIDGYAVVTHADLPAKLPTKPQTAISTTPIRFHFTVYDLAHGAKQIADVPVSYQQVANNVHPSPAALATCGSKVLLEWNTGNMASGAASMWSSVLDLTTGRTTAPAAIPAELHYAGAVFSPTLTDAACTTALVSTSSGTLITYAVDLTKGTVLWHNASTDHAVSMRDGVIYALRPAAAAWGTAPRAAQLVTLSAADGTTQAGQPTAIPLGFTGEGGSVFAAAADPAKCSPPPVQASPTASPSARQPRMAVAPPGVCAVRLWVGRS
jgi:hypothetical protein